MARGFASASSQYLANTGAVPVSALPLTLAAWTKPATAANGQVLVLAAAAGNTSWELLVSANPDYRAVSRVSGTASNAITTALLTTGVWSHGCAVFASSTSRSAYLNGGNKGTNSASSSPSSIAETYIGRRPAGVYFNGDIAEAAAWNTNLADAEVAILALGASPLLVRPQSLAAYWPLVGRYSPEIDLRGGINLTLTNSPTVADHPRIFYPTRSLRRYGGANVYDSALALSATPGYALSALLDAAGAATFTALPALSPAGLRDAVVSLALASSGGFTAGGLQDFFAALALSATGNFAANAERVLPGTVVFSAAPAFDADALRILAAALNLQLSVGYSPEAVATLLAAAVLTSAQSMSTDAEITAGVVVDGAFIPTERRRRR